MSEGDDVDFGDFSINKAPSTLDAVFKRPHVRNIIKRKFPGPAGILPKKKSDLSHSDPKKQNSGNNFNEITCTQTSAAVFENMAWVKATTDFRKTSDKFTVKWIKQQADLNKLTNQKAPFLVAIVQSIDRCNGKVPVVTVQLQDFTGHIEGTIIHSLYKLYSEDLTAASVIVLKQVGVLKSRKDNSHHLTITEKNLVAIYAVKKKPGGDLEETVKVVTVQGCLDEEVLWCDQEQEVVSDVTPNKEKKKFNFKKNCSSSNQKDNNNKNEEKPVNDEICHDLFEGVDLDSFFADF